MLRTGRGSAEKFSSMRTSMSAGAAAAPINPDSLSGEIKVYDADMLRPW